MTHTLFAVICLIICTSTTIMVFVIKRRWEKQEDVARTKRMDQIENFILQFEKLTELMRLEAKSYTDSRLKTVGDELRIEIDQLFFKNHVHQRKDLQ